GEVRATIELAVEVATEILPCDFLSRRGGEADVRRDALVLVAVLVRIELEIRRVHEGVEAVARFRRGLHGELHRPGRAGDTALDVPGTVRAVTGARIAGQRG